MPASRHSIFISYRRKDSSYAVDRLAEKLRDSFGQDAVFCDVTSIEHGSNFPADIRAALGAASVGLIVVGPQWMSLQEQQRIDGSMDWVSMEIEILLQRTHRSGEPLPVIPLFIDSVERLNSKHLPDSLKPLCERNGLPLRSGAEFDTSVRRLIEHLGKILAVKPKGEKKPPAFNSLFILFGRMVLISIVLSNNGLLRLTQSSSPLVEKMFAPLAGHFLEHIPFRYASYGSTSALVIYSLLTRRGKYPSEIFILWVLTFLFSWGITWSIKWFDDTFWKIPLWSVMKFPTGGINEVILNQNGSAALIAAGIVSAGIAIFCRHFLRGYD